MKLFLLHAKHDGFVKENLESDYLCLNVCYALKVNVAYKMSAGCRSTTVILKTKFEVVTIYGVRSNKTLSWMLSFSAWMDGKRTVQPVSQCSFPREKPTGIEYKATTNTSDGSVHSVRLKRHGRRSATVIDFPITDILAISIIDRIDNVPCSVRKRTQCSPPKHNAREGILSGSYYVRRHVMNSLCTNRVLANKTKIQALLSISHIGQKVKVWVLAIALLTWEDSWIAALHNLGIC